MLGPQHWNTGQLLRALRNLDNLSPLEFEALLDVLEADFSYWFEEENMDMPTRLKEGMEKRRLQRKGILQGSSVGQGSLRTNTSENPAAYPNCVKSLVVSTLLTSVSIVILACYGIASPGLPSVVVAADFEDSLSLWWLLFFTGVFLTLCTISFCVKSLSDQESSLLPACFCCCFCAIFLCLTVLLVMFGAGRELTERTDKVFLRLDNIGMEQLRQYFGGCEMPPTWESFLCSEYSCCQKTYDALNSFSNGMYTLTSLSWGLAVGGWILTYLLLTYCREPPSVSKTTGALNERLLQAEQGESTQPRFEETKQQGLFPSKYATARGMFRTTISRTTTSLVFHSIRTDSDPAVLCPKGHSLCRRILPAQATQLCASCGFEFSEDASAYNCPCGYCLCETCSFFAECGGFDVCVSGHRLMEHKRGERTLFGCSQCKQEAECLYVCQKCELRGNPCSLCQDCKRHPPKYFEYKPRGLVPWLVFEQLEMFQLYQELPVFKAMAVMKGKNMLDKNEDGKTALHFAVVHGSIDTVSYLLSLGADIESRTKSGHTALMLAVIYEQADCLCTLLDHKANVNAQIDDGMTVLMMAAAHGSLGCLKVLLLAGARHDIEMKESDGTPITAAMWAALHGNEGCLISLMLAAGRIEDDIHYPVLIDFLEKCRRIRKSAPEALQVKGAGIRHVNKGYVQTDTRDFAPKYCSFNQKDQSSIRYSHGEWRIGFEDGYDLYSCASDAKSPPTDGWKALDEAHGSIPTIQVIFKPIPAQSVSFRGDFDQKDGSLRAVLSESSRRFLKEVNGFVKCRNLVNETAAAVLPKRWMEKHPTFQEASAMLQQNIRGEPVMSYEELVEAGELALPLFKQIMRDVVVAAGLIPETPVFYQGKRVMLDEKTGCFALSVAPLKSQARCLEKVSGEYNGRFACLVDVVRCSAVVFTEEQLEDVDSALRKQTRDDFKVVRLKNRFRDPLFNGYRDALYNVSVRYAANSWHVCEVQLHIAPLLAHKEESHHYYEFFRTYFKGSNAVQARMAALDAIGKCIEDVDEYLADLLKGSDDARLEAFAALAGRDLMGDDRLLVHIERQRLVVAQAMEPTARLPICAAKSRYGVALAMVGHPTEAEGYLREALVGYRELLGDRHLETLRTMTCLGLALKQLGQDAGPLFEEAYSGFTNEFGENHLETLECKARYALFLRGPDLERASVMLKEVLDERTRQLTNGHPDTLASLNTYACALVESADRAAAARKISFAEMPFVKTSAESLHRQHLSTCKEIYGIKHKTTLMSLHNLGHFLHSIRKVDEAEALLSEALAGFKEQKGIRNPITLSCMEHLALVIFERNKIEAEGLLLETAEGFRQFYGEDSSEGNRALHLLATSLFTREQFSQVKKLLRDTVHGPSILLYETINLVDEYKRLQAH